MITRRGFLTGAMAGLALAGTGCSAGSLGSKSDSGASGGGVALNILLDNGTTTEPMAKAVMEAFVAKNPGVTYKFEIRPGGSEGDNLVKTRLATGDMPDLFNYNTGSLFQALSPDKNLVSLNSDAWVANIDDTFKPTVSANNEVYGAPFGTYMGGGIVYNRKVYDEMGLKVPTTWAEFIANCDKIKAAGKDAVIGTFAETWTSQLFVLGDFRNVIMADPQWAEKYTANKAKYVDEPAIKGFQRLEEVFKKKYMNKDFAAAKFDDGVKAVATGTGVHYPILSGAISAIAQNYKENLADVGFFGIPGDDAATNGATVWTPGGLYIPKTTTGDKLEMAKKVAAFFGSAEGCAAASKGSEPTGPYAVKDATLPDTVPPAVKDLATYIKDGKGSPALEFLSPVKGPALEQITVEVGSGIRSAKDGAALYDEDVKKQAKQLGLPGW